MAKKKKLRVNDFIALLRRLKKKHGNLPVWIAGELGGEEMCDDFIVKTHTQKQGDFFFIGQDAGFWSS